MEVFPPGKPTSAAFIVQGPGQAWSASAGSRDGCPMHMCTGKGGMSHSLRSFCVCALVLREEAATRESSRASSADCADPSISDGRWGRVEALRWEPSASACVRCKTETEGLRSTCRKKHITIDKSVAAARDELRGSYFMVLCTSDTTHTHKTSEAKRDTDPTTWFDSFLRWQEGKRGMPYFLIAAKHANPHISCAAAAPPEGSQAKKHLSHARDKAQIDTTNNLPKLTARNDPRKSQVIHSALRRPIAGLAVSVRTADLA